MKQFVVIGLGTFGFNVAVELAKQGYQVLAMDSDKDIVEEIKNHVTQSVVANAMDKKTMEELIDKNFDTAIIGLGENFMEATVISIVHLKTIGVKHIIVKSMNELKGEVFRSVGATEIIYPEIESAMRLARRLSIPALIDQIPLAPEYSIVEFALPDSFIGKTIKELNLRRKYNVTIIAIKNILQDEMILVPEASYKFSPDTALIILGKHSDIDKLKKFV
ncbi:MAG: TrkA family potassium uptake protein [Bacteroidota bacterium]